MLRSWSETMTALNLITGDVGLRAATRGAAEGEGIISVFRDFGLQTRLLLRCDANAAVGITRRLGLGRIGHLTVSDLWIQQRVKSGKIE